MSLSEIEQKLYDWPYSGTPCESCNAWYVLCTKKILENKGPCCGDCGFFPTHNEVEVSQPPKMDDIEELKRRIARLEAKLDIRDE